LSSHSKRSLRRSGYQVLVMPDDGRPARRWAVSPALLRWGVALLAANIALIACLFLVAGVRGARLAQRTQELHLLQQEHTALLAAAAEREEQLQRLAAEAEELALRLAELERMSDEIWRLLGYEGSPTLSAGEEDLGRGGPDDGFEEDVAAATLATVRLVASGLPARFQELEELRASVLARNHRIAHTPSIWPAEGRVTSEYGMRRHPITGRVQLHAGIDVAAPVGTPVYATADGTVVFAGEHGGYGLTVIIDHGYGIQTLYAHNSRLLVKEGDEVVRGQPIAEVGSTGLSTGPHVHYEVHVNGEPVNPRAYLPGRTSR